MNRITPKAVNNEQQLDRRIKEIERQVQSFPVRNVGGGGVSINWIRVGGGHELRATPKVIGIKTSNAALPDFLPNGLEPNDTSEGDFPDAFGYGYLNGITQVFVYARNAAHVFNALLGDPVGWSYPVIQVLKIPDQAEFATPGTGAFYTVYEVGVL